MAKSHINQRLSFCSKRRRTFACLFLVATVIGTSAAPVRSVDHHVTDRNLIAGTASPPRRTDTAGWPARMVIESIAVSADVELLHRSPDGSLQTPKNWNNAGWYADGVVPGDQGPAVIVGHVDSARDGPAVFYRLAQLRQGDSVLVQTRAGETQRFLVDAARQFPKTRFPTELVYGPTPLRELRLITCAGSFNHESGYYSDNLIVTAYAASTPQL